VSAAVQAVVQAAPVGLELVGRLGRSKNHAKQKRATVQARMADAVRPSSADAVLGGLDAGVIACPGQPPTGNPYVVERPFDIRAPFRCRKAKSRLRRLWGVDAPSPEPAGGPSSAQALGRPSGQP